MSSPETAAPPGATVRKCRSCGARVIWTITEAGYRMPVDAAPSPEGNIVVYSEELAGLGLPSYPVEPGVLRSRAATADELTLVLPLFAELAPGRLRMYRSHFATCPNAAKHRRPRKPR